MKYLKQLSPPVLKTILIVYVLLVISVFLSINIYNNFIFTYSLDDPYIHLALAKNLASGHYGIQTNEYASASSTILFPFLLVPFSFVSFFTIIPLLLNTLFTAVSIIFLYRIHTGFIDSNLNSANIWLIIITILWINPIGLIFTGMEHSLQVCIAIITFFHITRYIQSGNSHRMLILLSVINPLIRYEGFALVAGIILIFLLKRQYLIALFTLISSLLIPVIFSLYLHSINLPYLPYSVIKKSELHSEFHFIEYIYRNFILVFYSTFGRYIAPFYLLGLITIIFVAIRNSEKRLLALFTICVLVLHFSFGKFGAYGRYEVYAGVIMWLSLSLIFQKKFTSLLQKGKIAMAGIIILFLLPVIPYIMTAITTPIAAHNIYQQQYQMSRFHKAFFSHPVAVNDIGLVTFNTKNYVLDLFGISSGHAQKLKLDSTSVLLDSITKTKNIRFAMIYKSWFRYLPDNWVYAGDLRIKSRVVFIGSNVGFFLIDKSLKSQFIKSLLQFKDSLPEGVEFSFNPQFK